MQKLIIATSIVCGLLAGCSSTRVHETTRMDSTGTTYSNTPGMTYGTSPADQPTFGVGLNVPEPSPSAPITPADSPRGQY